METLNEQARTLSSGTIANLTGKTRYVHIDLIRVAFVEFCEGLVTPPERWQDAWEMFEDSDDESGLAAVTRHLRD